MSTTKSPLEKRSEIHLGDLALALSQLPWQHEWQAEKIAQSLGFTTQEQFVRQHQTQKSRSAPQQKNAQTDLREKLSSHLRLPVSTPAPPSPPIALPQETVSGPLEAKNDLPPPAAQLEKPAPNGTFIHYDEQTYKAVPHSSLLPENTSRGILASLLQTRRNTRKIDLLQLIRLSARGLPPKHLPYLQDTTLQQGCQLLLDFSESMTPWKYDLQSLSELARSVIGKETVKVYRFREDPEKATHRTPVKKTELWSPNSGTPVLVATDFALPFSGSEFQIHKRWRTFMKCCEQASSPLIFLLPWNHDTWLEKVLGPYPYLFSWSPATSSVQIKGVIGHGHKIGS